MRPDCILGRTFLSFPQIRSRLARKEDIVFWSSRDVNVFYMFDFVLSGILLTFMRQKLLPLVCLPLSIFGVACSSWFGDETMELKNDSVELVWKNTDNGWVLDKFVAKDGSDELDFGEPSGECAVLYSETKPSDDPLVILEDGKPLDIPGERFKYIIKKHKKSISPVPMNRAGTYDVFFPKTAQILGDSVAFIEAGQFGKYESVWSLSKEDPSDINVKITFTAAKDGYYSLPTPTLATIEEDQLGWGVVPGWYQGNSINPVFHLAYEYAQGLPQYPTICRESTITTMSSLMENKDGVTLAVTPAPGQDRNAFEKDHSTHTDWKIGLSHMNKDSKLTPTAYHPVLGQRDSFMKAGQTKTFEFTISLKKADWYSVYSHVIYDIYNLKKSIAFKDTAQSLTDRVLSMHKYLIDDKTSLWQQVEFDGAQIGAQSYLGGVHGADPKKKDAIKNSDIGAVWMLASITDDPVLKQTRLPFIRNFKVKQQQTEPGFFQGAAKGQYYLMIKKIFTEEWGSHFEPIGLTYYTLMDIGNILLFEPNDKELKDLLRLGADKLLQWQKEDGSWVVAYDTETKKPIFTDLQDLRPTFYGLVIAYKILGDEKYLKAAEKGADWFVKNAVDKGHFTGVCGDVRFVNDFATAQSAQALMDLYEIDKNEAYLDAAKRTAKMYTTSIYTHPIPTNDVKVCRKNKVYDWQLNQVGLCFEHGGSMGSATGGGPILLLSHCGMFVKLYQLTKDPLLLDLARAGALGRDAFVNPDTRVASYYWSNFNNGSGPFPHHAWWQVGWIMDYLVAEAEMRSDNKISFPRGFITPKVGPHRSLGFAPGEIYGQKSNLILRHGLIKISNPNVNYLTAMSTDGKTFFLMLMNDQAKDCVATVEIDPAQIGWKGISCENDSSFKGNKASLKLKSFGLTVLKFTEKK